MIILKKINIFAMKKIQTFQDYLTDKILEKMNLKIKELELILSPKMIKILKDINHKIADDLLDLHLDSEPKFKITFVDLGDEPDMVSFIQSNKVPELIEFDLVHGTYNRYINDKDKEYKGGHYDYISMYKNPWIKDDDHIIDLFDPQFKSKDHPVWTKFRSEIKIGRFIKRIFGNKYPDNVRRSDLSSGKKPEDVESFVNMFIATVEENSKKFVIVNGEDIRYWYNQENYFKNTGTLGGSCMKYKEKSKYFDIYSKNDDKVQMLILHPEDVRDKIIGRALVWKLDEPEGRYFMDRIYTANDSDEYMFIEYAKRKGWLYKSSQSIGNEINTIDPKNDKSDTIKMVVNLKPNGYDYYPYLDTMKFYNPYTGMLTNSYEFVYEYNIKEKSKLFIKLTSDSGNYSSSL
jgi:hypothetical protein